MKWDGASNNPSEKIPEISGIFHSVISTEPFVKQRMT